MAPPADGSKPPRISWVPGKDAWNAPGASSMEDVSLDPNARGHSMEESVDDHNSLLMPNPYDSNGRYADGGLQGKDYDYEMGLGAPGQDGGYNDLDDTHFNGDLDEEVLPAEISFNQKLRQEGALRRKITRKMTMGGSKEQDRLWADLGQQTGSPLPTGPDFSAEHEDGGNTSDETLGKEPRRTSIPPYLKKQRDRSDPKVKRMERASMSSMNSVNSIRDKISDVATVQGLLQEVGKGVRGESVKLQFNDDEVEDMLAMTEYAWPGRPMLDKLLKEEVDQAKGAIVVACECSTPSASFSSHCDSDLVLPPHRLRSYSVECFDQEGRRGSDRPCKAQGRRQEGLHRVRDGRVRVLKGFLDSPGVLNRDNRPLPSLSYPLGSQICRRIYHIASMSQYI